MKIAIIKKFFIIITAILTGGFFIFFLWQNAYKSKASTVKATLNFLQESIDLKQGETKNINFTLSTEDPNRYKISAIDLYFKFDTNNNDLMEFGNFQTIPNNYFDEVLKKEVFSSSNYGGSKILRITAVAKKPDSSLSGAVNFTLTFKAKKKQGSSSISLHETTGNIQNQVVGITRISDNLFDLQVSRGTTNYNVTNGAFCIQNADCGANAVCQNQACICNANYYNCDNNWENSCESSRACSQVFPTPARTPTPTSPQLNYQWTRCDNRSTNCSQFCQSKGMICGDQCNWTYNPEDKTYTNKNETYTNVGMRQEESIYVRRWHPYDGGAGYCDTSTSPLKESYQNKPLSWYCNTSFNVYCCCSFVTTPTLPPPTRTPTLTTPSGSSNDLLFKLYLKFQGINSKSKDEYSKMRAKVILKYNDGEVIEKKEVELATDEKGIWQGQVNFTNVNTARKLRIFIKGPKHLQKRICSLTPQETYLGSYSCSDGFQVNHDEVILDAKGIVLLAGDIDQDGIISAYDTAYVRNNLGKKDKDVLSKADFNLDGIVDTQDYSLLIAALSVKSDEQ